MKGLENGQLFCLYHQGVSLEVFVKNAKNSLTYLKVETRAIQAFLKFFVPVQNEKILRNFLAKVIPLGPLCTMRTNLPKTLDLLIFNISLRPESTENIPILLQVADLCFSKQNVIRNPKMSSKQSVVVPTLQ